eukprot:3946300-Pyramimonas_sp.AAC.1
MDANVEPTRIGIATGLHWNAPHCIAMRSGAFQRRPNSIPMCAGPPLAPMPRGAALIRHARCLLGRCPRRRRGALANGTASSASRPVVLQVDPLLLLGGRL